MLHIESSKLKQRTVNLTVIGSYITFYGFIVNFRVNGRHLSCWSYDRKIYVQFLQCRSKALINLIFLTCKGQKQKRQHLNNLQRKINKFHSPNFISLYFIVYSTFIIGVCVALIFMHNSYTLDHNYVPNLSS